MEGHKLYDRLIAAGLTVSVSGGEVRLSPPEKLTDELVALAAAHRPALLAHLRHLAACDAMQAELDEDAEAAVLLRTLENLGHKVRLKIDEATGERTGLIAPAGVSPEALARCRRLRAAILRLLDREALAEEAGKLPTPFRGAGPGPAAGRAGAGVGQPDGVDGALRGGLEGPLPPAGHPETAERRPGDAGGAPRAGAGQEAGEGGGARPAPWRGWVRIGDGPWQKVIEHTDCRMAWEAVLWASLPAGTTRVERLVTWREDAPKGGR